MIKKLVIKNFVLLDKLELNLAPDLNLITGETGTGKSLIIGSLQFLFGDKFTANIFKDEAEPVEIEAFFSLKTVIPELKNVIDSKEFVLKRRLLNKRTTYFLNNNQINSETAKLISEYTADIHGQHEHQLLFNVKNHIFFLDDFGNLSKLRKEIEKLFSECQSVRKELQKMKDEKSNRDKEMELFRFQQKEIEKHLEDIQEYNENLKLLKKLTSLEKIMTFVQSIEFNLYDSEDSIIPRLNDISGSLSSLNRYEEKFSDYVPKIEEITIVLEDLRDFCETYKNSIEVDSHTFNLLSQKIMTTQKIIDKYGKTPEEVIDYYDEISEKLSSHSGIDVRIRTMSKDLDSSEKLLFEKCDKLSEKRKEAALDFEDGVVSALKELSLEKGMFKVEINSKRIDSTGKDSVKFLFSANSSKKPENLSLIASGGEISRIMLALKTVIAEKDVIDTLVFDEIDSGLGGVTAKKVAQKLKELAKYHQLIIITHLPQIASLSGRHFTVLKDNRENDTEVNVREISDNEKYKEIARMLGEEKITDKTLNYVKDYINEK